METSLYESVRLSTELRLALEELHETSRRGWKSSQFYAVDRRRADQYFVELEKWEKKIREYLQSLRAQDEYVTYVDICGRAKATSLGAQENYSFSLQPISPYETPARVAGSNTEDPRFRGDIFSARDFNRFLAMIRRNGSAPAFVTFEPFAGLHNYIPFGGAGHPRLNKKVAFQILERNLRRLIGVIRPGGYLFLGPPFQFGSDMGDFLREKPQSEYGSSLYVKELCRKLKCSVEIKATINGPRWLIRKREVRKN